MNLLESSDVRMKCIKENSILFFNNAAKFPLDFVEFDVQVTKDGIPVIFHDNFILTQHEGAVIEKRIIDHTLHEFLCHGPQKDPATVGRHCIERLMMEEISSTLHKFFTGRRVDCSNVPEVVYMQRLLGAGVIVDLVTQISGAVSEIVMLGNFMLTYLIDNCIGLLILILSLCLIGGYYYV